MKCALIIITKDRADDLAHCIETLSHCNPRWDQLVVVDASSEEQASKNQITLRTVTFTNVTYTQSEPGSSKQRNIARTLVASDIDAVMYIDDDLDIASNTVKVIRTFFQTHPNATGFTGKLHGEIEHHASAVSKIIGQATLLYTPRPGQFTYGLFNTTNEPKFIQPALWMPGGFAVFNWSLVKDVEFDEWFAKNGLAEDFDFTYRLNEIGPMHITPELEGTHLKSEADRNWQRYGYMRIKNRNYIRQKFFKGDIRYWLGFWWANFWLVIFNVLRSPFSNRHRQEAIGELKAIFGR